MSSQNTPKNTATTDRILRSSSQTNSTPTSKKISTKSSPSINKDTKAFLESMKEEIIESFKSEIKSIAGRLDALENRISNFEISTTELRKVQERQSNDIKELKADLVKVQRQNDKFASFSEALPCAILQEVDDRKRRENNVILRGIKEQLTGSVEERKAHDRKEIEKVFDFLEIPIHSIHVSETARIGRLRGDGMRPIRIKFCNFSGKIAALRNSASLRFSDPFKSIYLNPDYTPSQQSDRKKLHEELRSRRSAGEEVKIFRNRVMQVSDIQSFH